jgi:hypothetical protein
MLSKQQIIEAEAAAVELEVVTDGTISPLPPFDGTTERIAPSALVRSAAADLRCAANDLDLNCKSTARTFIQSAVEKLNESEIDD